MVESRGGVMVRGWESRGGKKRHYESTHARMHALSSSCLMAVTGAPEPLVDFGGVVSKDLRERECV